MNFKKYLIERWITYTFIIMIFVFSLVIYTLDKHFSISASNANYLMMGWLLLFIIFVVLDYGVLHMRVKRLKKYCELNASDNYDEFSYPTDKEYAAQIQNLAAEYEKYKANILTRSSEELEFVTRWVHDVKVPLSAIRLILENHEHDMPTRLYKSLDAGIFSVEQSIQSVFYGIKANTFYEDYKIAAVSTKKLITQALKGYSNFFSYKKLNISMVGETYNVLTDEKWSGYILSQILSNAVKYTPEKGVIVISTSKAANEITISIKNSGQGILPQDMGGIFHKGYTSSENRNGSKATGYGLYLSKKLSDILGHRLTVQSQYGEYVIFSLTFIDTVTLHHVTKM